MGHKDLAIEAKMQELIARFIDEAKAIDPSIQSGWMGFDMVPGPHMGTVQQVVFSREASPFVRRAEAA